MGGSLVTSPMSFPREGVVYPWYQVPSRGYGLQGGRVYLGRIWYLGCRVYPDTQGRVRYPGEGW